MLRFTGMSELEKIGLNVYINSLTHQRYWNETNFASSCSYHGRFESQH